MTREKSDLLDKVQDLKYEICTLKIENHSRILILAKVHLKELLDLKENNNELQNSRDSLEAKLAARDEKLAESVCNNMKPSKVVIESIPENYVSNNFKCELCKFKAKSSCWLKSHIGHMHKDNERNSELMKEKTITEASIVSNSQVFQCKLCGKEFLIQEESTRHAYAHVILQSVDMTPV